VDAKTDLAPPRGLDGDGGDRDPLIGRTLSHYRIDATLGGGGMGVVYKAEDTRLHRPVALKFISKELSQEPDAMSRFAREAQAASALNHVNICTIHDVGEQDGRPFIVMEHLEGTTLEERLEGGALDLRTALDVSIQIADALEAAHGAGIVHRDIKPANIFVGSRDRVKVLDFGLAKMRAAAPRPDLTAIGGTELGVVMGTAAYMAPEQAGGERVDHRADIWSLGVVLYEMVKGARPVPGLRSQLEDAELERIIAKCLEPDRERRYQQAAELRRDLERLRDAPSARMASRAAFARRRSLRLAIGAGALVVIAAVAGMIYGGRPALLTDKDTIVLAEFSNTTGDPVFDDTLRQGLAVQLQQSPFLSLISDERIQRTLRLMNQPADARLTADVSRVVCVRTGGTAVLEGSIAALGSEYVLGLRATSCSAGDILAEEQAQAARKEAVLSTLSEIAMRFRTRLGESLATVERYSTPLEVTTPSLEALQAYSAGMKAAFSGSTRALPLFQRAVALDPDFALAYAQVGFRASGRVSALVRPSLLRAYELRDRASDVERFFIETLYDRDYTGNLERERRTLETWAESYPRDPSARTLIAGLALSSTGQHELAVAETEKAIELNPDQTPAYANRAFNQLRLNRLDDALLTVRRAAERNLESASLLLIPYFVAFLKGSDDELERWAETARSNPATTDTISHVEALALARSGRLQDARRLSRAAVEIAERTEQDERAALFEAAKAVWEAFYGNAGAARESAARALQLGRGRDGDYAAAFALALAGDIAQSQALAEGLARDFPEATFVEFIYLPTLRALAALSTPDPAAAIEALQTASRYDLALGGVGFRGWFGGLYPVYVRGLAYFAASQPAEAAGEFQRIVDHRSIVLVDPLDALARLQLARALALSGDTDKARRAYDDVLALWQNADAGIPLIDEARAERARLP
jgi:serine/threonine protein kinase